MGVKGLWQLLEPTSKPLRLDTSASHSTSAVGAPLAGKILAVDASIWLHQFQKALRDKSTGETLQGAHVVGFFRRICKLLFFGVKPVFVFDGGVPELKRRTINARRRRKADMAGRLEKTAEKLLKVQLQRALIEAKGRDDNENLQNVVNTSSSQQTTQYYFDPASNTTFSSTASTEQMKTRQHILNRLRDEYDLQDTKTPIPISSMTDLRLVSEEELLSLIDAHKKNLDWSSLNIDSDTFQALPIEVQHEIVIELKLKARAPNQQRVEKMIEASKTALDFSKEQIKNLVHRNALTQRVMDLAQHGEGSSSDQQGRQKKVVTQRDRVVGMRNRAFLLMKDDQSFGEKDSSERIVQGLDGMLGFAPATFGSRPGSSSSKSMAAAQKRSWSDVDESNNRSCTVKKEKLDSEHISKSDFVSDDTPLESILRIIEQQSNMNVIPVDDDAVQIISKQPCHPYINIPPQPSESTPLDDMVEALVLGYPDELIDLLPDYVDHIKNAQYMQIEELVFQMDKLKEKIIQEPEKSRCYSYVRHAYETIMAMQLEANESNQVVESMSRLVEEKIDQHIVDVESAASSPLPNAQRSISPSNARTVDIGVSSVLKHTMTTTDVTALISFEDDDDSPVEVSPETADAAVLQVADSDIRVIPNSVDDDSSDDGDDIAWETVDVTNVAQTVPEEESRDMIVINPPEIFPTSSSPFHVSERHVPIIQTVKLEQPEIIKISDVQSISKPSGEATIEPVTITIDSDVEGIPEQMDYDEFDDDILLEKEDEAFNQFVSHINTKATLQELNEEETRLLQRRRQEQRDASDITSSMVHETQELLRLFGLPFIVAPTEAEAQCAYLDKNDLVDGIVTDDSDVFLFGAKVVLKNMFNQSKYVEQYTAADIANAMGLDQDKLIQLAYLLGSDYTEGVLGVGPVLAMEMLNAWNGLKLEGLEAFKTWFLETSLEQTLKTMTPLQKKLHKMRTRIDVPDLFPDPRIYESYISPMINPDLTSFEWGVPDLKEIREFLNEKLGWSEEKVDQVLIPVLKEMNRRQTEGTQMTIDKFFPVMQGREMTHRSNRIQKVVNSWKGVSTDTRASSSSPSKSKGKGARGSPAKKPRGSRRK